MDLPAGLRTRPLAFTDVPAVLELMAAQELADLGETILEEADVIGDWQRPSFDVESSTLGVFAEEQLVAYAEVSDNDHGEAAVHPEFRGRGIGTALAHWMQHSARAQGMRAVGTSVPAGSPGETLLRALGYRVRWNSWVLQLAADEPLGVPSMPAGYVVREASAAEWRDVWEVAEDAFLEWADRARQPYQDFAAQVFERPGFAPWQIRVALDPTGRVIGVGHVRVNDAYGYLPTLAVQRAERGRGLARALLVDAFGVAREHGATSCELSTDSRTGALSLYERIGMRVTSDWVHYAIDV